MQETITTWTADPTTIGPMYPWVGAEFILFIVCVVFWILYTLWQLKFEHALLAKEKILLQQENNLVDAIKDNQSSHLAGP